MSRLSPIFIPTYARQEVGTLRSFSRGLLERTILVVDSKDTARALGHSDYLVSPEQGKGSHRVKEWIRRYCIKEKIGVCIILDDDLRLQVAYWEAGRKRFRTDPMGLERCVVEAEERCRLPGVGFCSFSNAFFNTTRERWLRNKDGASTYFVNVLNSVEAGTDFLLPALDDRWFVFNTLAAGLDVWAMMDVASTPTALGKRDIGGETSLGRRSEELRRATIKMALTFPGFVSVRPDPQGRRGCGLRATYYMDRLWKAVRQGRDVRVGTPLISGLGEEVLFA